MSFKLPILVAYPYMKKGLIEALLQHKDEITFLLDSGAFTAWKSGNPIKLDDYCRFLDQLPITPWRYFALDVVGDHEKTMRNYEIMLERGYSPIPVFTPGQSFDDIDKYYETTDLIGCGGLVKKYSDGSLHYLQKVMKAAKGRKVHLLGYTKPDYIKLLRPYSCDSSSWSRAQRYGLCDVYLGRGTYIGITRRGFAKKPKPKIVEAVKRLGVSVTDLMKEENWRGSESLPPVISARTWVMYSRDALPAIDTRIFFALGDVGALNRALEARAWVQNQ